MKKNDVKIFGVLIILCCAFMLVSLIFIRYNLQHNVYAKSTIVSEVDYSHNLVIVKDFNNVPWTFFGCDDWEVGDICGLVMDNNGTPHDIFDDKIVSTNYCGYVK